MNKLTRLAALIAASSTLFSASKSFALPLLAENAATRVSEVFTVYPDHEDPTKFYYFPNAGALIRDARGVPVFTLAYWGLENTSPEDGGGTMTATFQLKSDSGQTKAKAEFLKQNPGAGLAVMAVKASHLNFGKFSYVKYLDVPPHAGRAEDHIGITAELNKGGARTIRAMAKGSSAGKVDYCYKVQGLGPTMDARITIEFEQIYDYFRASVSAGALWWRTTLTAEVENLKQRNLIRIEINGGDAKMEEYVMKVVDMMVAKLFVPSLEYGRNSPSTVFDTTPLQINANYVRKTENKRFDGFFKKREIVERDFCVTMPIIDVKPYYDDLVINGD